MYINKEDNTLTNKLYTAFKGTENTVICYFGISTYKIKDLKASNP
jgi:DNA-directed RNA polymerase subunit L